MQLNLKHILENDFLPGITLAGVLSGSMLLGCRSPPTKIDDASLVEVEKDAEKNGQKGWNLKDNAPELLQVLNDHLNTKKEPSLAIRAIYGEKLIAFFLLDKKWVRDTQDNIFPDGEDEQDYFSAAWETYISFARPFNDVFTLIEKQYRRAIRELGKHTDRKHHLENPDERLAQHLMAFYWSGVVDFVKKDSILVELYHYALVEVKREIIEFMGRNLKEALPISDEVKRRLIYLLESRLAVVKKSKNPKDDSQEFQGFSWWVASGKLDTVWCLKQLREILKLGCDLEGDHIVMEKFVEIAPKYPLETIQCARMMVENDKKGWGVSYWRDEIRIVIETAPKSSNKKAVFATKEFVNRLAARGHLDF